MAINCQLSIKMPIFAPNSIHYETCRSIKHQERLAEAHPTARTTHTEQREGAGGRHPFGRPHGTDEGTRRLPYSARRPHLAHQRHNMQTTNADGVTLTQLMARKDVLTMRVGNLRSIFETASAGQDRYSRSEIKTVTVVDVKAIGKKVDECSAQLRQLDMEIQALNFQTELV